MTVTGRDALILDALLARVATHGTGLSVSYPEAAFDPPTSGKYLAVSHFPNRPAWEGMSSGRMDQGLLQISVVWLREQGLIAPAQIVAQIIDHFPLGLAMVSGAVKVKVSGQPWAAQPIIEDRQVQIPVTIPWSA